MSTINIKKSPVVNTQTTKAARYDTISAKNEALRSSALKGLLMNNFIKKQDTQEPFDNFDRISTNLLIPENVKEISAKKEKNENKFDFKKVMKPILLTAGASLAVIGGISIILKKYSLDLANKTDLIQPEDLARNINIVEEPHFAMFRALRDPSTKNILGLGAVGLMTGITIIGKNFIDGAKEAWIKKRECDINHGLQESLIDVEAEAFAGKIGVVNNLLINTTNYFKSVLSENKTAKNIDFKNFLAFKGNEEQEVQQEKENNKKLKNIALIAGGALAFVGIACGVFKNYQKTVGNLDTYIQRMEDKEIKTKIQQLIALPDKEKAKIQLQELFKTINLNESEMIKYFKAIGGLQEDEIGDLVRAVQNVHIYSNADKAMYGTSGKIQYYCYINEDRGHLYNWVLNPENKFNKYLFLSFSSMSVLGYLAKASAEAVKNVTVAKENSKSELELRKKLVSTEINNFKAKKLSVINPLLDNFIIQMQKGKSKAELKELAENILVEIKNGPPFVYG